VGSTPRFAPGSKAKPIDMEVDTDEIEVVEADGSAKHTPLRGVQHTIKRKAGELFSGSSASKMKPN